MDAIVPIEVIEEKISLIRGHKVMLDTDLAVLYGVTTNGLMNRLSVTAIVSLKILCSN